MQISFKAPKAQQHESSDALNSSLTKFAEGNTAIEHQQSSEIVGASAIPFKLPGRPKVAAALISEVSTPPSEPKVTASQGGEKDNPLPVIREESLPSLVSPRVLVDKPLPLELHRRLCLLKDTHGNVYVVVKGSSNPVACRLGSKKANALFAEYVRQGGAMLRPKEIAEINEVLEAHAEQHAEISDVWHRIAKVEGGVVLTQ